MLEFDYVDRIALAVSLLLSALVLFLLLLGAL